MRRRGRSLRAIGLVASLALGGLVGGLVGGAGMSQAQTLAEQWRRAFRIGVANRARGAQTTSVFALIGMAFGFLRTAAKRSR